MGCGMSEGSYQSGQIFALFFLGQEENSVQSRGERQTLEKANVYIIISSLGLPPWLDHSCSLSSLVP